jgi:hypothetical protein
MSTPANIRFCTISRNILMMDKAMKRKDCDNLRDSMFGALGSARWDFRLTWVFCLMWQGTGSQAVDLHVKALEEQDQFLKQLKECAVSVGVEMEVEQDLMMFSQSTLFFRTHDLSCRSSAEESWLA